MNRLVPAEIPESEVLGMVAAWLRLWERGDKNTERVVGEPFAHEARDRATQRLYRFVKETMKGEVWLNDKYQVHMRECPPGPLVHLSIRRLDRSCERDWRDYQEIKNQLVGEECEAVELYPAESRLVDCANQYHLWCYKDTRFRFPFGWKERMVQYHDTPFEKAQQRQKGA